MTRIKKWLLVAAISSISASSFAGSDSGVYFGASLGTADADFSSAGFNYDDDDVGMKLFGGFNFGLVPTLDFAAEISYIDFGKHEGRHSNAVETDALAAAVLVGTNVGPVGVFAKLGVADWDADYKTLAGNYSDSGTDALFGVGAKVQMGSFGVRAEYERFDFDHLEIDYYSVGAVFVF